MSAGSWLCSRRLILTSAIIALAVPGIAAAVQAPVDDSWPEDENERDVSQVNEGQLKFIAPLHDQGVVHADTRLWLTAASLQGGWMKMRQCYRNLDVVDKTEIVYTYPEMTGLRVTQAQNISRYRIRPRGVELEGVAQGALLCIKARVKVLRRLSDKIHGMRQGPYHRRFLDGYYPYHLSLTLFYSNEIVRLRRIEPEAQDGFEVSETATGLVIESWFEGKLNIELEFTEK